MKDTFNKKPNTQKGSALVTVLVVLVIVSLLAISLVAITSSDLRLTSVQRDYLSVYYIAESGISYALNEIKKEVDLRSGQTRSHEDYFADITNFINLYIDGYNLTEFEPHFGKMPFATISLDNISIVLNTSDQGYSMRTTRYTIRSTGDISGVKRSVVSSFDLFHRIDAQEPSGHKAFEYIMYQGSIQSLVIPNGATVNGPVYGYKVETASSNARVNGDMISLTDVVLSSGSTVTGNIYAHGFYSSPGTVNIESSNCVVEGNIHAKGNMFLRSGCTVNSNVYTFGSVSLFNTQNSNQGIQGDVHAGGNISMQNNTNISGSSWAGGSNDHVNRVISPREAFSNRGYPPIVAPSFLFNDPAQIIDPPQVSQIDPDTSKNINIPQSSSNYRLSPGEYGNLFIGGASRTVLETGDYVFNSFDGARWGQTLRLDLSSGGPINVYVKGDIRFSGAVEVSENGTTWTRIDNLDYNSQVRLGGKVYWETHGNVHITSDNSVRNWFGSVLAKNSIITESGAYLVGAFATIDGRIEIKSSNAVLVYSPPSISAVGGSQGSGNTGGATNGQGVNTISEENRIIVFSPIRENYRD